MGTVTEGNLYSSISLLLCNRSWGCWSLWSSWQKLTVPKLWDVGAGDKQNECGFSRKSQERGWSTHSILSFDPFILLLLMPELILIGSVWELLLLAGFCFWCHTQMASQDPLPPLLTRLPMRGEIFWLEEMKLPARVEFNVLEMEAVIKCVSCKWFVNCGVQLLCFQVCDFGWVW